MNYHQLIAGGIYHAGSRRLLQGKSRYLSLIIFLLLNVSPYRLFIDAHRGNKVSSRPETAWGQFLRLFLDPGRRLAFQNTDGIGNGILGWDGKVKMNMFVTDMPTQGLEVFPTADHLENSL